MLASVATVLMAVAASVSGFPSAFPDPVPNQLKKLDGVPQFNLLTEVQGQDHSDANNLLSEYLDCSQSSCGP